MYGTWFNKLKILSNRCNPRERNGKPITPTKESLEYNLSKLVSLSFPDPLSNNSVFEAIATILKN